MQQKNRIHKTAGEAACRSPAESGTSLPAPGTAIEHRNLTTGHSVSTWPGIPHDTEGDEPAPGLSGSRERDAEEVISSYLRSAGIVHRALRLFEDWKYQPARIICSCIPVDIIAIRRDCVLLVQVISSRAPDLDAATLTRQYGSKIQNLRAMGTQAQFRKILLAYSRNSGWKYYDVLPGGLIPAWDLPEPPAP
ncbi:hypothetical protein [Methanoregula sp.]|uniref:hypothetical protein n=1 Tax=Methanoregula sp. TaxID=2052170 RepID=UPI003563CF2E